jgi:hypothetical protein
MAFLPVVTRALGAVFHSFLRACVVALPSLLEQLADEAGKPDSLASGQPITALASRQPCASLWLVCRGQVRHACGGFMTCAVTRTMVMTMDVDGCGFLVDDHGDS